VRDEKYFHRIKWEYMVLDEAQAIKSSSSSRWRSLLQFQCRNRLLLTGTPIQNSMAEVSFIFSLSSLAKEPSTDVPYQAVGPLALYNADSI